ncbi:MAG: TM2 domain-containing protein [Candidatus Brocadiae bacterium]|nr:TM2 domain-containing protein [Candidatus Brocadiia bacterium]
MPEKENARFLIDRNQRQQNPKEEETIKESSEPEKSLVLSYFLLVFFGIFGAHRLYLRCYRSGILYGLTFGFLGIGIVLDIFLVPFLLKAYRKNKDQNRSEWQDMAKYETYIKESLPAWCKKEKTLQKIGNALEVFLQFLYLIIAPIVIGVVSVIFWQPAMPFVLLLWVVLFLSSSSLKKHLAQRSLWRHVPFLEFLHQRILQAEGFYFQHQPKSILVYFLYPMWMPFLILFKPKRREELYCYLWIILGSLGLIFSGMVYLASLFSFQYSSTLQTLLVTQGMVWFGSFLVFLALSIPYFTSFMSFKTKKNQMVTKIFGGWGLVFSSVFFVFLLISPCFVSWETYSHQDAIRSMLCKLQANQYKEPFQEILTLLSQKISKENHPLPKDTAEQYTKKLRLFIRGIASCKESQSIQVSYLEKSKNMLVHIEQNPLAVLLPDGSIQWKWTDMEKEQKEEIEETLKSCIVCPYIEEYRKYLDIPFEARMLD